MTNNEQQRVLAMSALGKLGRFGNQVFQYAFLRICARASGAAIQTSPWVGQLLFGHDDPPVSLALPPMVEGGSALADNIDLVPEFLYFLRQASGGTVRRIGVQAMTEGVETSGDLIGFFQWHSSAYRPHADYFRSLFQPCTDLEQWLDEPLQLLRDRGKTVVAIHLRTGDYRWLSHYTWIMLIPPEWWAEWLDAIWHRLDEPVLYVCSNDVGAVRHAFERFNPVCSEDLRLSPPPRLGKSADFLRDFHVMTQADVLGISNSSFSFAAAMLNRRAKTFVRPTLQFDKRFAPFDPWNAEVLVFRGRKAGTIQRSFGETVRLVAATEGRKAAIAAGLLRYPASRLAHTGIRLQLAHRLCGWRGVKDLLRGRSA